MDSVVKVRECQWCHEPYYLSDGRYKYCSDECAEKARLAKENRRKSKNTPHQSAAWLRYREEHWLRLLSAPKKKKRRRKRSRGLRRK